MLLYASTIFLSAFLLFQVQLIVAKMILPWFGGTAAVWATCMLFFQVVLVLGYLYADRAIRSLGPKAQAILHIALLCACLPLLPIVPGTGWKPSGAGDPTLRILLLLAATVGLPYLLLSATSPLLQAWYARTFPGASPYRLFALSNAGSMLGLLSYPAAVEPFFAVRTQAQGWSAGFVLFGLLCAAAALRSRSDEDRGGLRPPAEPAPGSVPSRADRLLWVALAACASALLLAVTNHLTQNVAPIPFLWVLPLALYLMSFIVCFSGEGRWYRRGLFLPLFAVALGGMSCLLAGTRATVPLKLLIPVFAGGLFVCCMVCHGELARMKPHPGRLTAYYLMISLGGAAGGLFVGVLAPNLFRGYFELPVAIAACAVLVLIVLVRDPPVASLDRGRRAAWIGGGSVCVLALAGYLGFQARSSTRGWHTVVRNFYGSLMVGDHGAPGGTNAVRTLVHGGITHGSQFVHRSLRRRPTAYYGPKSGVALALGLRRGPGPQRVGVVGLGAGTLACYGRKGDRYRFYEINPLVIRLAEAEFRFLADSEAEVAVVPGDARLSMEREPVQGYDVLAVDAFSGDSIPVHLLTREAFALYFRHLKEDGVLAVHVSNKYLDLKPVVARAAEALGKEAVLVDTEDEKDREIFGSAWILLAGDRGFFETPEVAGAGTRLPAADDFRLWTDDYSNLIGTLK